MQTDITTVREKLGDICQIPESIISVYVLEKHIWENGNDPVAIRERKPELRTIDEFQIDPVRPFLNDIFRLMAAPHKPERGAASIGQGYWIQAEFGSGKSHLLCFLASLTLGSEDAWEKIRKKEEKAKRGKRESLYQFWENGLKQKSSGKNKGIFIISQTLVGVGGGTVGYDTKGRALTDYILDAAKNQLQKETGKNISLYPVELLADRFINKDLDRYRADLKKFLKDPKYFEDDEFEDIDDFVNVIRENKTPEYKKSCGDKLWRFYHEYLGVRPDIEAETEDVLKHMVKAILAEGYSGVLILLDEVSIFMKNRDENLRSDDEKTLVVLSNRLAKVENLPVWTVCAAQQAIESKMAGVKNIIADDRLKLVLLLQGENDYYNIALARVREIIKPEAITGYYNYYKRGFSWPNSIGEDEFRRFFPFHKPALEVLKDITYELTTERSAIHFMHQTLKQGIKQNRNEIIRLWEFFDEAIEYEEDPSGTHAGIAAIRTKREMEYKIYLACKRGVDEKTKGALKVHRDRAVNVLQILFLNFVAKRSINRGLTPDEIANSVLSEVSPDATMLENVQHYETLAVNLAKEFPQIAESADDDGQPRFRFIPETTDIKPVDIWKKARNEAESNPMMQKDAWLHLLALDRWPIKTRKGTYDLSHDVRSIFRDIAPYSIPTEEGLLQKKGSAPLKLIWKNREIMGRKEMVDLQRMIANSQPLVPIQTEETDQDFAVIISTDPLPQPAVLKLLSQRKDPRIVIWTPGDLLNEEQNLLLDFAAYRKVISDCSGKESDEANTMIMWVSDQLQTELGKIEKIVTNRYDRGEMNALNYTTMEFHVAGELGTILNPVIDQILSAAYESRDIDFSDLQTTFTKEYGVNVINGIVKTGTIPKGVKRDKNIDAAENFGKGLKIIKSGNWRELDLSHNPFTSAIERYIDEKAGDPSQTIPLEAIFKNFSGINGPDGKHYGLSKRIIQIFLLCLVRTGKIRIHMGPKNPLQDPTIDYTNIDSIDFSTKVVEAMGELQRIARPENWDVLRPYAEKILGESILENADDAALTIIRKRLFSTFSEEKEQALRTSERAQSLFAQMGIADPYAQDLIRISAFFSIEIDENDFIEKVLYGMKDALGYGAFERNSAAQSEVDDLAITMSRYAAIKKFLSYEPDLLALQTYRAYDFTIDPSLKNVQKLVIAVNKKLEDPTEFIDNELKLKSSLIGSTGSKKGEKSTLTGIVEEYTSLYRAMHDKAVGDLEKTRTELETLADGEIMRTMTVLQKISALAGYDTQALKDQILERRDRIVTCEKSSVASIGEDLRKSPVHHCGIAFGNYKTLIKDAGESRDLSEAGVNDMFTRMAEFFLNPSVRENFKQVKQDSVIKGLLACESVDGMQKYLIKTCADGDSFVETITRYLKKVVVKPIRISSFTPSSRTIEREKIPEIVEEFRQFLEAQFDEREKDDAVPVIQLE
jgi:hypothetical protein